MIGYALRRVVSTVPVFVFVALFVFFLLRITPGDPAIVIAGDQATSAQIEAVREQLGLNRPMIDQLSAWGGQLLHGDLGRSVFSDIPVTRLIAQRLEPTVMLALVAIVFALVIALPLGTLAAVRAGGLVDRIVMAFAVLGFSSPVFVVAFLLVYVFALSLGWFPTQGYVPLAEGFLACLRSLVLPGVALALLYASLLARVTRASLLEVLSEDYIRTANAKGLAPSRITIRHALSNAAVPIVTVVGIGMAALLGGVVVTETVFNIPGLGRLATDAIQRRDYPVVQGLILLFSSVYVVINLLVDLSYVLFDPRVRY
ncbi:ABC transporter permease [Bradyrhizobium sp. U87765 SZCCT0131]|uniref:ABC transporter permease n=1 Tax=unclassified Bradyrhizobium TaxID=2631580 RepID=UPI001BA6E40E|nr:MULTISPECIES: ABC transporter permease [unclassified Bradyrhizobium]MBR1221956.1 ABC transporter permease [Bradyrhizobium sp. U87765 SZCCT0131]MBR1263846.1 ABC transporter permease [Bradyrhizobium sp. U87765 SZCCT0134]MBR1302584.1 ABC transporter permease [Bradyrhizobium sp. U87765 SZCCT0110]MBR1320096.1 ABC transporter permease [Bradyrhizobium sp. U87765 SZCCT0109]MBR1348791.1 ABC transporter permease [Bradyrhizobium sp. U87765 SZCCT0048]